jgi:hypothetical protein
MKELTLASVLLKAINEIGDYFEYAHESEKDKKVVMGIIDDLTAKLKEDAAPIQAVKSDL